MSSPSITAAERRLLGAMLLVPERIPEVGAIVSPADFAQARTRLLFGCLKKMNEGDDAINFETVGCALEGLGDLATVGGREELILLSEEVTSAAHLLHHARLVANEGARRRLVGECQRMVEAAKGLPPGESVGALVGVAQERLLALVPRAEAAPDGPVLVNLADVQSESLRWLWPGRIPLGKLTLLAGDPGLGKSTVTLDIAARVSGGLGWPDAPDESGVPGDVLILSAEDGVADTIKPRMEAAGGDMDRVRVFTGIREGGQARPLCSLDEDLVHIERALDVPVEPRLLIVDPLTAYMGSRNSHRDADIRGLLTPLADLAQRRGVAVLCVVHLNKAAGMSATYRVGGSIATIAAARMAWVLAKDGEHPERRLLVRLKGNVVRDIGGLALTVESCPANPEVPVISWASGSVTATADDLLGPQNGGGTSMVKSAGEWLRGELAGGPVPVRELEARATRDGVSWTGAAKRASKAIGVVKHKDGDGGAWTWSLPEGEQSPELHALDEIALDEEGKSASQGPGAQGGQEEQGKQGEAEPPTAHLQKPGTQMPSRETS